MFTCTFALKFGVQGHGKSDGVKPATPVGHVGYVHSFDDVAWDMWQVSEELVVPRHPGLSVFIQGHCFGGALLMRMMQLRSSSYKDHKISLSYIAGLIITAPSYVVDPKQKPNAVTMSALSCLSSVSAILQNVFHHTQ
jgi:alpha-beta hydrolase superfamily lysophospholipase